MDTELAKATFPLVGGALALAGGIFTFISGRLRDAADEEAKDHVLWKTWFWIAIALWMGGAAVSAFSSKQLWAVPFFAISFAIHWRQFVADPNPPSRKAIAIFAFLSAMTAFAILFAVVADLLNRMAETQSQMLGVIKEIVEVQKRLSK